jgi:hypothetical protein
MGRPLAARGVAVHPEPRSRNRGNDLTTQNPNAIAAR